MNFFKTTILIKMNVFSLGDKVYSRYTTLLSTIYEKKFTKTFFNNMFNFDEMGIQKILENLRIWELRM